MQNLDNDHEFMKPPHDKPALRTILRAKRHMYAQKHGTHAADFLRAFQAWMNDTHYAVQDKCVAVYMPMQDEASCQGILDYLLAQGIDVALPVMQGDTLHFAAYDAHTHLIKNDFGFFEPAWTPHTLVNPDMLIMPLLGMDAQGYRIGYGKGHYDRYLHDHPNPTRLCIGLALPCQKCEDLPREPHDKKLDAVLFPGTYTVFS